MSLRTVPTLKLMHMLWTDLAMFITESAYEYMRRGFAEGAYEYMQSSPGPANGFFIRALRWDELPEASSIRDNLDCLGWIAESLESTLTRCSP